MGFSYRKTRTAGPFRITASKSGISYSIGGKGIRVTKRADGRVQTTISAPGTGLRYTAAAGTRQKTTQLAARRRGAQGGSIQPRPAMRSSLAQQWHSRKPPTGRWYFVITLMSLGVLTWMPFAHAASRLDRRDLRVRASAYGLGAIVLVALAGVTPTDANGSPTGGSGRTLSTIVGAIAVALMAVGCYQLVAVRRTVYGNGAQRQPTATTTAEPAVAAYLAGRARRQEARALAESDPVMADDLGIGRPDLLGSYDDGGLVDLNSAPASSIAAGCSIAADVAERIAATRRQLGSFSSFSELFALADVDESTAARIREHGVLIHR